MKNYKFISLFLLMMLPLLAGCSKEEITFDIELPRFELRDGYQLLEVIVPQGTGAEDKIYIVGEFNGGMDAVGDPRWQLEKASDTDAKFGVYLNPADFVNGKTLADGYTFYNARQGEERSLDNQPVVHRENPAVGQRENVIVYRWADYFNKPANPGEIDHDGYAIYVVDNSGYDELALYAYGDGEIFGGWPGIQPTGSVTIDGVVYKYFDTGAANEGMNVNLIFNNNGAGKQLADYNVTLNEDFYLEITADGVTPYDPSSNVKHDGFTIYVADQSGWDDLYLYMWGDVNDLNGAWPGMPVTGTQVIKGVTYKYFDLGEGNCNKGLTEHLILNNGNGKQVDDVVVFALDRDVYVELTSNSAKEIDPDTYTPSDPENPPTPPAPSGNYKIYVQNNTGWQSFYIYAWGDTEVFGAWPGMQASSTETVDGVEYLVFPVEGNGEVENLIFNDNAGLQYDAMQITLSGDCYIIANPENATLLPDK